MGLFSDSADADRAIALRTADVVAGLWNSRASGSYGFQLFVESRRISTLCEQGAKLFETGEVFPRQPGPFKRTAAFLVLGRLYPFFRLVGKPENLPHSSGEQSAWTVRFMALTIPVLLRQITVTLDGDTKALNEWNGFPSLHYQLEFFAWLRWLDNCERFRQVFQAGTWAQFSFERLARMVMGTALILESCYYLHGTGSTAIQSQISGCLANLTETQELDLIYAHNIARPPETEPTDGHI